MKKKIICLLITLAVAVSVCCALTLSAEAAETSGDLKFILNSDGKSYTVAAANTSITTADIPGTFNGKPVTSIGWYSFRGCSKLTSVYIPNSVTSIGEDAFNGTGYYNNTSNWTNDVLYIGNYLIKAKNTASGNYSIKDGTKCIANLAFSGCSKLTSVTIPNSVTSIGWCAFSGCSGLTELSVDEGNTVYHSSGNCIIKTATKTLVAGCKTSVIPADGSVTSIGNSAFEDCSGLTSVSIPDSVTSIGWNAFYGCSGLKSVTIGNSVTSIGNSAFYECRGLTSVTIGNGVTSIGSSAFYNCWGLKSVKIPNSVTSIGESAFYKCDRLTSVTIPNSVTSIGYRAFYECTGLTSVTIGNSVTSIDIGAFSGCSKLTSVVILNGVTSIGGFSRCSKLTSVVIPNSVTSIGESAFSGCSGLKSVTIPNSVTSIGKSAFYKCSGLKSVTIGNSVTSIGKYAFYECSGLTSVTIGNSVTSIGESAFYHCWGLTSVVIPNSVTSIGESAFYKCSGLKSVTIGNSVTGIGDRAFWNCSGLTSVYITDMAKWCGIRFGSPYANPLYYAHNLYLNGELVTDLVIPDGVTSIGNIAFYGCTGLTSVTIPNSVTSIGEDAFYGCSKLTSVTIGNSVTSIGEDAFYDCTELTSITIPDSVTSIGNSAFDGCSGLTSVTIPNSVTSIGYRAFYECSGLTSVSIGNSVTSIGSGAFAYCSGLTSVYITDIAKWCGIRFGSSYANPLYYAHNLYLNGELVTDLVIPDGVTSIGNIAFYGCTGLTSVTIPNSVTSIGESAFYGCSGLTSVKIPSSDSFYPKGGSSYKGRFSSVFSGYSNLKVKINDGVTSIGSHAFRECRKLTSVSIPNSVTSIGRGAFNGCSGLTELSVDSGNTVYHSSGNCIVETASKTLIQGCNTSVIPADGRVTSIGWHAFEGCSGLTSVSIPNSVTSIGDSAFSYCSNLETIYFNGTEAKWKTISKGSSWDINAGKDTAKGKYTLVFLCTGYTVSGTATSFGSQTDNVTIQLIRSGTSEAAYEAVVQGNESNYSIENVESGTYTLRVSKKNHVTREYIVTIGDDNFTQDVIIYLVGDVNGDGKINGTDYLRIRGAFLKTYTLSDEFLKVADVNGDGRINGTDYLRVRGHYLGTYNLYK